VKTYQWGIKSSCPQKGAFRKTFSATLAKDSVAWVNGHVISRGKAKRADLHLYIDGKRRDRSLSEDLNNQWVDQNVMHAINLKKGKHTFEVRGTQNTMYGCGEAWGDLDVLVVPKFKGVMAFNEPDRKSGCPLNRKANTALISKTITLTQTSIVKVAGHMIRSYKGRADLYLRQNNVNKDWSLSYTDSKRWEDVKLHYVTTLKKGKYTFSLVSNRANAFGCGSEWGDIDILVLPQKISA